MYLTQAALFVGYEKGLKAVFSGENPFIDEKGNRKSIPTFLSDLFVEVGKMALMFKFLGWWQTRYRVSTVGQNVLKDPMAKEILQEAFAASPRLGRGLFSLMMQEEIAARGLLQRIGVKVEAFAAEAVGFQIWTNIGVTLDTFYQNVPHGKKLVWRDQIISANKPEAMLGNRQFIGF
jgi:hypothetical protein